MPRLSLIIPIMAVLAIPLRLIAQTTGPSIIAQKSLGGSGKDIANDVVALPDGGFLLVGSSYSNDGDVSGHHGSVASSDAWVCRLNADLSIRWQRSLGGTSNDGFMSVSLLPDGNFVCFGNTDSGDGDAAGSHGGGDLWLVRLDRSGNIIGNKFYGGTGVETLYDGVPTSDGGFALIGTTSSMDGDVTGLHGGNGNDIWVVKCDAAGSISWQKTYGNDGGLDYGSTIVEAADRNLVASVHAQASTPAADFPESTPGYETFIIKLSVLDGTLMAKSRLASRFEYGSSLARGGKNFFVSSNGSIAYPACANEGTTTAMIGLDMVPLASPLTMPFLCMNPYTVYSLALAHTHGTLALNDTTFLGAGIYSGDPSPPVAPPVAISGNSDALFVSASLSGQASQVQWKTYGGSGVDAFNSLRAGAANTEFVAAGYTTSNDANVPGNHGAEDAWIVVFERANRIQGKVFIDRNANGVMDPDEPGYGNAIITSATGGDSFSTVSADGTYRIDAGIGTYLTTIDTRSTLYTVDPASHTSVFNAYKLTDQADFALKPIPGKRDYGVTMIPLSWSRPGNVVTYLVNLKNKGTDTLAGNPIRFIKDPRTTFVSSIPAQDRISGDTLAWDRMNIGPGKDSTLRVSLLVGTPPTLGVGDTVLYTAYVDSTGDLDGSDNFALLRQPVMMAVDPNEKTEIHGGSIDVQDLQARRKFQYTIHFQNTGNDTAFKVVVRDTLPAGLDASTLAMIRTSHANTLRIAGGNILEWTFPGILLPDSTVNEPASQGSITYAISPVARLQVGDTISNRASIYFDYALPVVTDMAHTIVRMSSRAMPAVLGVNSGYCRADTVLTGQLSVMPSPGSGASVRVSLDTTRLPVDSAGRFMADTRPLAFGDHRIRVILEDIYGKDTSVTSFRMLEDSVASFHLQSSATQVSDTDPNIIITANALAGGGPTPRFEFTRKSDPVILIQGLSAQNTASIDPKTLDPGVNWIRVSCVSSAACVSNRMVMDSIAVTRTTVTGLSDPDLPGSTITAYPNPISGMLALKGLSTMKNYVVQLYAHDGRLIRTEHVSGRSTLTWAVDAMPTGTYFLRIIDERKNRALGTIPLIKR